MAVYPPSPAVRRDPQPPAPLPPWPPQRRVPMPPPTPGTPAAAAAAQPAKKPVGKFWRVMRWINVVLAALMIVGILAQAYFVGRFLFGADDDNKIHEGLGWTAMHLGLVLTGITGLLTKGGKGMYIASPLILVLGFMQPFLATLNNPEESDTLYPAIAALHPLNALVLFALLIWVVHWHRRDMKLMKAHRMTPK